MGKRATAVTTGVAKKVKVDPITEKCRQVYTAFEKSGDLPEATCEMLKLALPLSLGICQNDRHQYQQSTVEVVATELEKIKAKHQNKINDEENAITKLEQEKQSYEAMVTELENKLSTKQAMINKNKLKLCEEATAFQNAKAVVKEAENEQKNLEKELVKAETKKANLEGILRGNFQSLKEGSVDHAATEVAIQMVTQLRLLFDVNETLATTIPSALGKIPASRGPFDTISIQHIQEDMEKCLTEWSATLRDSEKMKTERALKVQAAHEVFNTAQERQLTSADTFMSSRNDMEETQRRLVEAKKKLKGVPVEQKKAEKRLQDARNKLEAFCQGPFSAFAELRDRNQLNIEGDNSTATAHEVGTSMADIPMIPTEA